MEAAYRNGYCRYDWFQISSGGGDVEGVTHPRQCGTTQAKYIVATPFSETKILFKSDGSITDRGFNMSYELSPCGGIMEGPVANVLSPNFPANYPDNVNCYWYLKFTPGSQIEIRASSFSLDSDCAADNVTIRNGGGVDSPVLWSGCGATLPPTLMSQSNVISIQFVSDGRSNAAGFNISALEHTAGCGGILHGMSGKIVSPRTTGDTKYPNSAECIWLISADDGYIAKFNFSGRFDIELTDNCDNDYIEVQFWNTSVNTWTRLGDRMCGRSLPDVLVSPSGRSRLVFRSNQAITGDGFTVDWSLDCGGVFYSSSGSLSSPGYPGQYANNLNCNYTIVPKGEDFIIATFVETFDIELGRRGCDFDRVEVVEVARNMQVGSFCGTDLPEPVSTRGRMMVNLITDRSETRTGFKLISKYASWQLLWHRPS